MIRDANNVRQSNNWCNEGQKGMEKIPPDVKIECNYLPFVITCLLDAVAFSVWLVFGYVTFRHARENANLGKAAKGVF